MNGKLGCAYVLLIVFAVLITRNVAGYREGSSELFRIADLQFPDHLVSIIPDIKDVGSRSWQDCFVFSVQNPSKGKFDLHCKHMTSEEAHFLNENVTNFAGDVVVTGCVRAVISQTPCYSDGLVLDTAKVRDESGQACQCNMYLLKREGGRFNAMPFSLLAHDAGMYSYPIEESQYRGRLSESNYVSRVWLFRRESICNGLQSKWSIIESDVDLNSFSNISERVILSYEDSAPQGLSM